MGDDHGAGSSGSVADDRLDELIHRADLDGLVRLVDDRCGSRDWDGLLRIRDRSRRAVATGRQLWPAATLAEYRLALLAPASHVAAVLDESDGVSGRFTIGPLTEVAAQYHTWSALEPHLDRGPRAAFVAHERILRGEAIPGLADLPPVLDGPGPLEPWEPDYALAEYTEGGATFPAPDLPSDWTEVTAHGEAEPLDDDVDLAIRQLVEPWTTASNGQVETVCVDGDVLAALHTLGVRRARLCHLAPATAIAWLAWAGASGGAHGRRRGAAAGRFGAWWVLGALGDLLDTWPPDPDELGAVAEALRWFRWDAHEPAIGWSLQIAIHDPDDGVSWAITARDAD